MHQQGQNIVFAGKGGHVIAESARVDFYGFACQHSDNRILQAIHIHLDINFQGFIGFGLIPIGAEFVPQHRIHNRFRAVHGIMLISGPPMRNQVIAIIPCFGLLKAHLILFAKSRHF